MNILNKSSSVNSPNNPSNPINHNEDPMQPMQIKSNMENSNSRPLITPMTEQIEIETNNNKIINTNCNVFFLNQLQINPLFTCDEAENE